MTANQDEIYFILILKFRIFNGQPKPYNRVVQSGKM